ncbi:BLUF domain-containing protein [Spirosoma endophyticum]|uniref:Sensors of blue-light using FAD n=1 Tax=Spirosoma endophyticum TaxID=662367 RepID=A0A1I2HWD7_9BACT|nr:BLUF domain-containing protein [Spirosoma endophyticum]SFF33006.1 Sensors of blue-light using FAD [Spirosoma endophyticum]
MDTSLIYFSVAVNPFEEAELLSLLAYSRSQNSQLGITEVLLYVKGNKQAVESLYQRIALDPRHNNVSQVINRPISQRLFPQWAMGYETITQRNLEAIQEVVKLDSGDQSVMTLPNNAILRALQVFYDGNRYN